jgi:hypothetical protein
MHFLQLIGQASLLFRTDRAWTNISLQLVERSTYDCNNNPYYDEIDEDLFWKTDCGEDFEKQTEEDWAANLKDDRKWINSDFKRHESFRLFRNGVG